MVHIYVVQRAQQVRKQVGNDNMTLEIHSLDDVLHQFEGKTPAEQVGALRKYIDWGAWSHLPEKYYLVEAAMRFFMKGITLVFYGDEIPYHSKETEREILEPLRRMARTYNRKTDPVEAILQSDLITSRKLKRELAMGLRGLDQREAVAYLDAHLGTDSVIRSLIIDEPLTVKEFDVALGETRKDETKRGIVLILADKLGYLSGNKDLKERARVANLRDYQIHRRPHRVEGPLEAITLDGERGDSLTGVYDALPEHADPKILRAALKRIIASDPQHLEAHLAMARSWEASGRITNAIARYQKILKTVDAGCAEAVYGVGKNHLKQKNYTVAATRFREALRIDPYHVEAENGLHKVTVRWYDQAVPLYNKKGKKKEALALLDKALKYNPNCSDAHRLRGMALEKLGRKDDAIASYRAALAPENSFWRTSEEKRKDNVEKRLAKLTKR